MTARESILQNVRTNQPQPRILPVVPRFHSKQSLDLSQLFVQSLKKMAGDAVADYPTDFDAFLKARFPAAKRFCSVVPEFRGTCTPADFSVWSDAEDIDVTVVRSPLGVAETGSVLLSERELQVNPVGFLAHDVVVLLDPLNIIENIHDAYDHPYFRETGYCLLMTGPSGSADIGAVTVHPAQASMTLTVVFAPRK